ncbi:MAG: sodium:proline symporter, partial [Sphingomonadales bacterium]
MHLIDWLIAAAPIPLLIVVCLYVRRYVHGVTDFMAGGRNAGRYLIATARGEMGAGAVVFVALFQIFEQSGFTVTWWSQITVPIYLFVAVTGFVIYRYRQTRALTLAQFFEMRYSRRFRLFTGLLAFGAGVVNFGIIPCIGARFMV